MDPVTGNNRRNSDASCNARYCSETLGTRSASSSQFRPRLTSIDRIIAKATHFTFSVTPLGLKLALWSYFAFVCGWAIAQDSQSHSEPAGQSITQGSWWIETVAGTGEPGGAGDGGPATLAQLNNPFGVVRGPDGALWFCEYGGHKIRRIGLDGVLTTYAGSGFPGRSPDGTLASDCALNLPHEIRFDPAGNLVVVDTGNHWVRRFDRSTGQVTTVAGTGTAGYRGDGGPATDAQLQSPHSIQFNSLGDLVICDIGNHVVRKVDARSGTISTIAGIGKPGPTQDDRLASESPLHGPRTIDFDTLGNWWLATREGNQLFQVDGKTTKIYRRAGTGKKGMPLDSMPGLDSPMNGPKGITVDRDNYVWLADTESHTILRYAPTTGVLERIAGTLKSGDGPDGPARECSLARPHGIFADADGAVYIGDSESHRIRKLSFKPSQTPEPSTPERKKP